MAIDTLRQLLKYWLYGMCPGFSGSFRYFGARVFFPKGSITFKSACEQGIYEQDNVHAMLAFARDDSLVMDVGANIGLMAVPLLASRPNVNVMSFEVSPETLRFLAKTRDGSAFRDRWEVISKAAGGAVGKSKFCVGAVALGAFDGFKSTGRVAQQAEIDVEVTTIDVEWHRIGCPDVSVIKADVEGAEYDVLRGASACIAQCRPAIIVEWSRNNIGAYGRSLEDLLDIANTLDYRVWALPGLAEVRDAIGLRVQASITENYLLVASSSR